MSQRAHRQRLQLFQRQILNPDQDAYRLQAQALLNARGLVHNSIAAAMERFDVLLGRLGAGESIEMTDR